MACFSNGQTVDNIKRKWSGHTDSKLTNLGFAQAEAAGKWLKDDKFTHVYSSDLTRTRITCEQIVKSHNFDSELQIFSSLKCSQKESPAVSKDLSSFINFDPLLREQHFGELEGLEFSLPEVRRHTEKYKDPQLSSEERRAIPFPGPGGECRNDSYQRAKKIWSVILENVNEFIELQSSQSTSQANFVQPHVLIVSHGAFIRELINAIADHPETKMSAKSRYAIQKINTHNTGIWRLNISTEDPLEVLLDNSVVHLDAPTFTYFSGQKQIDASGPYDPKQSTIDKFFTSKK